MLMRKNIVTPITHLVVDIVVDVVELHGMLHSLVWLTHFFPLKYVPAGQEQPSTRVPRQHLSSSAGHFPSFSHVDGIVMFASYPPLFAHGRQQGISVEI